MKYVVAVSGGVDSVVLLDMLVKSGKHEVIVAHFDHGIRQESAADARFVQALAKQYGLPFETQRAELGSDASEELARVHRYKFLRRVAAEHSAGLATAHHQDDVIETIAINLVRGTGWRGLAVLNDTTIARPLRTASKSQLYEYALTHNLEWVEDVTNASDVYLRNRLRRRLASLSTASRMELIERYDKQREIGKEIDNEASRLKTSSRYFLTGIEDIVATELLRAELAHFGTSLTRPRLYRLLHAVKTAKPGDTFQAGNKISVGFTTREFIVKHPL